MKQISIALAGNPNSGKTTVFNELTGEKRAVGNYSGVTVEMVRGTFERDGVSYEIADLPGAYSLASYSKDEAVAREFLLAGNFDAVVNVVDASNPERNLFLTLQLLELGLPLVVALNMCDLAESRGLVCDAEKLSTLLQVPVVKIVGTTGEGIDELVATVRRLQEASIEEASSREILAYSKNVEKEITALDALIDEFAKTDASSGKLSAAWLSSGKFNAGKDESESSYEAARTRSDVVRRRRWLAVRLLEDDPDAVESWNVPEIVAQTSTCVERLSSGDGTPVAALFAAERYGIVRRIASEAIRNEQRKRLALSDKADRLLTHPLWGLLIFFASMYVVFWLTFTLGDYPVSWLEAGQEWLGDWCGGLWPDGSDSLLRSLVVDGIIAGVGGVLVFFPNIFILFAAISALEESGYMARGAFLTDRFLRRFGLVGKSFIPMLVGFGCSIPAIMSTRIIEDKKSRLSTIFVVPLMSCGARYPIYMLLIPAFFPAKWQAPVLWLIYVLGIILAAILSSVLTSTKFKGEKAPLLIELPLYHAPTLRTVGGKALDRGLQYLRKAGTTILGVSIILWALSTFPVLPKDRQEKFDALDAEVAASAEEAGFDLDEIAESIVVVENEEIETESDESGAEETEASEAVAVEIDPAALALLERRDEIAHARSEAELEYSIVGRLGKCMEPVIRYAGFDWRIGSALVGAFAAKEVFVAQMGIVFRVGEADENSIPLRQRLSETYSPLVGLCIILFCLIAAPCMATFVITAKEASWLWALAQWATLTVIGFVVACVVYQVGSLLGIGV